MLGRAGQSSNLPKSRWGSEFGRTGRQTKDCYGVRAPRLEVTMTGMDLRAKTPLPARTRFGLCAGPARAASWQRPWLAVLVAGLLGACAVPPKPAESALAVTPPAAATSPAPAVAAAPTEAPAPATPAASTPAPATAVAPSAPPLDVPRALAAVRNMLDLGEAADAERELLAILQAEPQNNQAQSLLKQIREDPQVMLGRESYPYRVAAGETLSTIAGRLLRDPLLFYALARYNSIKVPRQLTVGQTIRVPGRASAQGAGPGRAAAGGPAASKPADGPAATKPGDATATGTTASPPTPAEAASAAAPVRTRSHAELIAEFTRTARSCGQRQDPCCAVTNWDKVLELNPAHGTAKLEKQKEQERIERLRKQGGNPGC
jgi:LysM domain